MKKLSIIIFSLVINLFICHTQIKKVYTTSGGEFIFSFAEVKDNGKKINTNIRFTLFFHYGLYWNYNLNKHFGIFTGLAVRNVGFVTDTGNYKIKRRSYALGAPLGFKIGSLDSHTFLYLGGEYEMMFHYKEKIYENGDKSIKNREWLSDRTNMFIPSLFIGAQFSGGYNLKFKYYLNNFLNKQYSETVDGNINMPYEYLETQVFYISLSFNFRTDKIKKIINKSNNEIYVYSF